MKIRKLSALSKEELSAILDRGGGVSEKVKTGVAEILREVKKRGEVAVLEFTQKLDGVDLSALEVSAAELSAVDENSAEFGFLREAARNIEKFHANQLENIRSEKKVSPADGIEIWREWRPIQKVGIYAPGGLAIYPSSVLMQAIPAKIAGCEEIILATPAFAGTGSPNFAGAGSPNSAGEISTAVIAAAKISGVTKIIKCGGAQAIGALYYVYNVQKITGPGNPWVTEAKKQLSDKVAIDMPAGPSEILILADDTAVPKFVAADLLSQAEHAASSKSILATTSEKLAGEVEAEIEKQISELKRDVILKEAWRLGGEILIAKNLGEAIDFTNEYAPEHLEICVENPESILPKIVNAGSVFLGNFASEPAGDFATGANHVLPTAGFAKNFSPLSVESFGKKIQIQKISKKGLSAIRGVCEKFGEAEGLDAHARSVAIRFEDEE
ncbi:histidinol dehydrogenase [Patescibacteria group bacterium]|nr:histidinol dehydrogenase [Patescibacteria group bacterium]